MVLKDLCCLAKLLLIHLLLLDSHAFANGNSSFLAEPRRRRSSAPWRRERYATTLHSGLSNFFFGWFQCFLYTFRNCKCRQRYKYFFVSHLISNKYILPFEFHVKDKHYHKVSKRQKFSPYAYGFVCHFKFCHNRRNGFRNSW